jgi:hypothetical protein
MVDGRGASSPFPLLGLARVSERIDEHVGQDLTLRSAAAYSGRTREAVGESVGGQKRLSHKTCTILALNDLFHFAGYPKGLGGFDGKAGAKYPRQLFK